MVRRDAMGESLGVARVVSDPLVLAAELANAGPEPEVEATYGWACPEIVVARCYAIA